MSAKGIPETIKKHVEDIVNRFNEAVIQDPDYFYVIRYRGDYLYLSRQGAGMLSPICRLKYNGALSDWEFAIYRYSSERYDPDEWHFPGSEHVDGTIEGAMRAGLEAYP